MEKDITNQMNLCSDIDYFAQDATTKFHFRLKPEPIDLFNSWVIDVQNWAIQPTAVKPKTDWSLILSTDELGELIFNLRNICSINKCSFVGEHYQYPADRIVKIKITDEKVTATDIYQVGPGKANAFKRHLKKKFEFEISTNAVERITTAEYPDKDMYTQLIQNTVTYRLQSYNLFHRIMITKKQKNEKS